MVIFLELFFFFLGGGGGALFQTVGVLVEDIFGSSIFFFYCAYQEVALQMETNSVHSA